MNTSSSRKWFVPALFLLAALSFGQTYSPLFAPSTNNGWYAYCIYGGYYIQYCDLSIQTTYYSNTNGHFHNTSRPHSSVSPNGGNTGSQGYVPFTLTTTVVGQAETVITCAYSCGYSDYAVGYSDIYWTNNAAFTLVGGNRTNHGDNTYNHWMMSAAAYDILYSCQDYLAAYGGSTCSMNDMALPFGGKFDIYQNWTSPHVTHDRGRAADINYVNNDFLRFCRNHGAVETRTETNGSQHCRF